MEPRISMITLGVKSIARSVEFYEKGLSLPKFEFDSEHVAFFRLSGTWLGLFGREALAEDANVSPEGSGFAGVSLAYIAILSRNVRIREVLPQRIDIAPGGTTKSCSLKRY